MLTIEEWAKGKCLPGFSWGILGSPQLTPKEADKLVSRKDREAILRWAKRNPLC
jgi:hypothetical protein